MFSFDLMKAWRSSGIHCFIKEPVKHGHIDLSLLWGKIFLVLYKI